MAYATFDDIAALVPELPAIQKPSRKDVVAMCADYSMLVDMAYKKHGYSVPITDANDVGMIGRFVAKKVAADVLRSVYRGQSTESTQTAQIWEADWNSFLSMVRDGSYTLQGQDDNSGGLGVMFFRRHNAEDDE